MPREIEGGDRKRKHHLGNDARVIWILHKHQPLDFVSLLKETGLREYGLRYDILPFLIDRQMVRELKKGADTQYVLEDYVDVELAVTRCMEDFILLRQRWPSLEEIATRVGKTPQDLKPIVYQAAAKTGWEKPSKEALKMSPYRTSSILELAAFLRAGCGDTMFVRQNWKEKQRVVARGILDRFPDYVPSVDAYTIPGDIRNRSGMKFYYVLNYPPAAIEIVGVESTEPRMVSYDDFPDCTTRLKIQERTA